MFANLRPGTPVFLTGHTGFKGSWFSLLLSQLNMKIFGYSLPPIADSLFFQIQEGIFTRSNFADIRNKEALRQSLHFAQPEIVIHFAAQPLVLESYKLPLETFEINVQGTANLLEIASSIPSVRVILVITTDKVYKNTNNGKKFIESDCLEGSDPYSCSKVGAESVATAWRKINILNAGPQVIVARAGNVIGGGDVSNARLIPDIIRAVRNDKLIQIRSAGATRPWQHVLDPLMGYLKYIDKTLTSSTPPALNFGPLEASLSVHHILEIALDYFKLDIEYLAENSAHKEKESLSLDLDSQLAVNTLSWIPIWTQDEAVRRTFTWWQAILDQKSYPSEECLLDIATALQSKP